MPQFVIMSQKVPDEGKPLAPLAPRKELLDELARYNTAPESRDEADVLYGPGIRIEMPPMQDPVTQLLLTLTEEDIGWLVLRKLARQFNWRVLDPETGREWKP
jgi:hypothetical protein